MSVWTDFVSGIKSDLSSASLQALEEEIPGWQALAQTSAGRAAITAAVNSIKAEASSAASGNFSLSGLLGGVTPKWAGAQHFALRLAEGLVGLLFLAIGLNALLHNPAGSVARTVAAVK